MAAVHVRTETNVVSYFVWFSITHVRITTCGVFLHQLYSELLLCNYSHHHTSIFFHMAAVLATVLSFLPPLRFKLRSNESWWLKLSFRLRPSSCKCHWLLGIASLFWGCCVISVCVTWPMIPSDGYKRRTAAELWCRI